MNCVGCIYAEWHRDAKKRLHFKGTGHCTRLEEKPPQPFGGYINRNQELSTLCPFKVTRKSRGADLDSMIRALEDAVVMVREADEDSAPRAALVHETARIALKQEYMRLKDDRNNTD